jgi:hypothetical protein
LHRRVFSNSNGNFAASNSNNRTFIDYSLAGTPTPKPFSMPAQQSSPSRIGTGAGVRAALYQASHHNTNFPLQQSPPIPPFSILRSPLDNEITAKMKPFLPDTIFDPFSSMISPTSTQRQPIQMQHQPQQIPRTFTFPQGIRPPEFEVGEFDASGIAAATTSATADAAGRPPLAESKKDDVMFNPWQ